MRENVTALFVRMRAGDQGALKEVVETLYRELHTIAAREMRKEGRAHTLQPTALVNEAYLRLLNGPDNVNDRNHFLALAATAMRRALVDHARQKRANKRGGKLQRVTLDGMASPEASVIDVLVMDGALTDLAVENERAARVVELKFFGGHTNQEAADILGLSLPTIRRDWEFARGWLQKRLQGGGS